MVTRSARAVVFGVGLLLMGMAACGQKETPAPAGELILALQTDMALPKDVDKVRIRVASFGNTVFSNDYQVGPNDLKIPATLGLLPNPEHPSSPVTIQVVAFRLGKPRVLRETITTVPTSRIATLRMPIEWLCDDSARPDNGEVVTTCAPGETCVSGTCVTSEVDSTKLPDYTPTEIFGGGDGSGNGACFDVAQCFGNFAPLAVDPVTCRATLPSSEPNLNLALKLTGTGDGICSGGLCLIPLDGAEGGQWSRAVGGLEVQLPTAACERIGNGKVEAVIASTRCPTKTARTPTCGPWSSAGGGPNIPTADGGGSDDGGTATRDAGNPPFSDVTTGLDSGCPPGNCNQPPTCAPPPSDGGFCMGVVSTPPMVDKCRWDVPGQIATTTGSNGFCANLLNVQLVNVPNMSGPAMVLPHVVEGMCPQAAAWQFVGGTSTLELCPMACATAMSAGVKVEFVYGCPTIGSGPIGPADAGPVGPADAGNMNQGMVLPIVGGSFMIGCAPGDECNADEMPYHQVVISDYAIDETEVTQGAYDGCVRSGACVAPPCSSWQPGTKAQWPVTCVNWDEANKYCNWVGKRLPTEAEWETAARGMNTFPYPWGTAAPDCTRANHSLCAFNGPQAVRSFVAGMSPYRAHDMAGNVAEWVQDWYGPYEAAAPMNTMGPPSGVERVLRGGHFQSGPADIRASRRQPSDPNMRIDQIGFRCAKPG